MSTPSPLDGTWELVRAELDGEAAPELLELNVLMEFDSGNYLVRFSGEVSDRGHFELGETGELKTLLIRGVHGANAGRTLPCIYQQVGERLRVCYGLGGEAPTDFKTAPGTKRYLATYRRTKATPEGKKEAGSR